MSEILASQMWDIMNHSNDGMDKLASISETYLRDRIRETCLANRVLPPVVLTEATIDTNTQNDFPLKRVWLEPDSKAFTMGFRGRGYAQFAEGRKYEVWFAKFETEHFKKTQEELMTMKIPFINIVNNNFVFDLQEQVDGMFQERLKVSAIAAGNEITASGTINTGFKEAIIEGARRVISRRRRAARLLMTESTWLNLARLKPDKIGYDAVGRIAFNGVAAEKVFMGYEVLTTINANNPSRGVESVWNDDEIFVVTSPEYLGSNFMLNEVQQEMKRTGNMLEWYQWTDQGLEIGNISSVAMIKGVSSLTND